MTRIKRIDTDFRSSLGMQNVGRNKPARRQQGRVFPAIGAPETPILRLTRGQAYSGLRRDVYNDESRSLGTNVEIRVNPYHPCRLEAPTFGICIPLTIR